MSPSVMRWRTARVARERRAQLGEHHTGTWAAFARAHVAWNGWRCVAEGKAPQLPELSLGFDKRAELTHAYTTADLRARGAIGFDNRHDRKRKALRALVK